MPALSDGESTENWVDAHSLRLLLDLDSALAPPYGLVELIPGLPEIRADLPRASHLRVDEHGARLDTEYLDKLVNHLQSNPGGRLLLLVSGNVPGYAPTVTTQLYLQLDQAGTPVVSQVRGVDAGTFHGDALIVPLPLYVEEYHEAGTIVQDGIRHREEYDLRPYPSSSNYPIQHGYIEVMIDPTPSVGDDGGVERFSPSSTAEAEAYECLKETSYGYCTHYTLTYGSEGGSPHSNCTFEGKASDRTSYVQPRGAPLVYAGDDANGFARRYASSETREFETRIATGSDNDWVFGAYVRNEFAIARQGHLGNYAAIGPELYFFRWHTTRSCPGEETQQWGEDRWEQVTDGTVDRSYGEGAVDALTETDEFATYNWNAYRDGIGWNHIGLYRAGTAQPQYPGDETERSTGRQYGVTFQLGTAVVINFKAEYSARNTAIYKYTGETVGGDDINDGFDSTTSRHDPNETGTYLPVLLGLPGTAFSKSPMWTAALIYSPDLEHCRFGGMPEPPRPEVGVTDYLPNPVLPPQPGTGISLRDPGASRPIAPIEIAGQGLGHEC